MKSFILLHFNFRGLSEEPRLKILRQPMLLSAIF